MRVEGAHARREKKRRSKKAAEFGGEEREGVRAQLHGRDEVLASESESSTTQTEGEQEISTSGAHTRAPVREATSPRANVCV